MANNKVYHDETEIVLISFRMIERNHRPSSFSHNLHENKLSLNKLSKTRKLVVYTIFYSDRCVVCIVECFHADNSEYIKGD